MIKRTIEISREPAHLSLRLGQLVLEREHQPVSTIPCEDLGMVIVDHSQVSYTHSALAALVEHDAVVVVCGKNHLPAGLLLPMTDHSEVVWRLHDQIAVSKPLRKQLWRQIVQAKIRAQANNLPTGTPERTRLLELARTVRSGDVSNHEAQAARVYWSAWLSDDEQGRSRMAVTCLTATPSACARNAIDREDAHADGVGIIGAQVEVCASGPKGRDSTAQSKATNGSDALGNDDRQDVSPERAKLASSAHSGLSVFPIENPGRRGSAQADPLCPGLPSPGPSGQGVNNILSPNQQVGVSSSTANGTTRSRSPFRRDANGEDEINGLLNYGYSILRAAVARAIVMAGLHPAFGLQHCNRSNLFCLADDLMEPLRPLVDARVRGLVRLSQTELSPITKAALLQLLTQEATTGGEAGPLMVTLHRYVASLVKCYAGESEPLEIPEYVPLPFDPKSVEAATPSTSRSWAASRRRSRPTVVASELANRPF